MVGGIIGGKVTDRAISAEERTFFVTLGERIASLRKVHNITQVQLAETLGVSQQTVQAYEMGKAAHSGIGSACRGSHAGLVFGRVVWRDQPPRKQARPHFPPNGHGK